MRRASIVAAGVVAAVAVATLTATAAVADRGSSTARTTLHLADGTDIGRVRFNDHHGMTHVKVSLTVPDGATAERAFHGFHVHANNDPVNGEGCRADPEADASTWFVSADGHFKHGAEVHAGHAGDMPSLHLNSDGTAEATFTIDRVDIDELDKRVVILHAGPDNFGNVPADPLDPSVPRDPNKYTPNSQAAIDRTAATGNAGDRIACGVIKVR